MKLHLIFLDTSDKYSDSSSMWVSESSPPPPPPGVDSPPPPPPQSPPPDSPPPPPPDSTEVEDLLEDMDIENSDDSNPPLIVTNSGVDTPADTVMPYPKFVGLILCLYYSHINICLYSNRNYLK